jgi:hypothetical protein
LLGGARRLDRLDVAIELRIPLVVLAALEAVEGVEALTGSNDPAELVCQSSGVVPLPERGGVVAITAKGLGDRRQVLSPDAVVAGEASRALGDAAYAALVMIAPGQ